jgi:hypothetical protein
MRCEVCLGSRPAEAGSICPQCGWDAAAPQARNTAAVLAAREAFKARTLAYAPDSRVSARDKAVPWLGVGLGFVLFMALLAACRAFY